MPSDCSAAAAPSLERERRRALGRELDRLLLRGAGGGREGEHGDQGGEAQATEHDENLLRGGNCFRPGYGRAARGDGCGRASYAAAYGTTQAAMAMKCTIAAAITSVWKSSWNPKVLGHGSGRLAA